MVTNLGHIYFGDEKWFITKVEVDHGIQDSATLTIYLPRSINNPKVITKKLSIYSNSAMWSIVESLQKRYPHAVYWKTGAQRKKMHYGR